jgi:hypothetical protein
MSYYYKMKLRSFFHNNKLSPKWIFSTQNTLWRVMFTTEGLVLGEDRNTDTKSVTFFCLNATTGKILWKDKQFTEQWWTGLEGVKGSRIFLHGFKKPDMPEHKAIICVDLDSGDELWRNNDCTFLSYQSPYVYGYRDQFERRIYHKLDEITGICIDELLDLPHGIEGNVSLEKTDFLFPQLLSDSRKDIAQLIGRDIQEQNSVRQIEIIEIDKFLVCNIHSINQSAKIEIPNQLTNTLYIIDVLKDTQVFSDVLNEETPYPAPDSFFIDNSTLYYIKERKSLVSLDLNL